MTIKRSTEYFENTCEYINLIHQLFNFLWKNHKFPMPRKSSDVSILSIFSLQRKGKKWMHVNWYVYSHENSRRASKWKYSSPRSSIHSALESDLEKVEFLRGDVFRAILKRNNGLLDVPSPPVGPFCTGNNGYPGRLKEDSSNPPPPLLLRVSWLAWKSPRSYLVIRF